MFSDIFIPELIGTAILLLLGVGVVANVTLKKTGGHGGGTLMINWGWGIAVLIGVYAAYKSGGHLNPAVSIGQLIAGNIDFTETLVYIAAQMLGAFIGAIFAYLAYKQHYDETDDPAVKLGTFSTAPGIKSYGWNLTTEAIATFVLVFWVLISGLTATTIGPVGVALVIVGIGASLGGPTGYAINPARDLGPRIAHALLPIKGKGDSNWSYAWVPIVGPILGAVVAALLFIALGSPAPLA